MLFEIDCTLFRGGTSKGLCLLKSDLPKNEAEWEPLLLSIMGSPDLHQIDGLGGGIGTASKAAIISKSERSDCDIEYLFAQVSVDEPVVSYRGNCGNMSAAVGPYAIEMGLVPMCEPVTHVRIYNVNTKKIIHAEVPVRGGHVLYEGDYAIAGVPGTGARIGLSFLNPEGSASKGLLPTGNVIDRLSIPDFGELEVSFVDASNPLVFVRGVDVGLEGDLLPNEIDGNAETLGLLEKIRGLAAVKLGYITDYSASVKESPTIPKLVLIAPPKTYQTTKKQKIEETEYDLSCRQMSMQRAHKNYALTGALCTAAAAVIEGTLVQELVRKGIENRPLRIGHPGGIIEATVRYDTDQSGHVTIAYATGYRTARILMRGTAYYKKSNGENSEEQS